MHGSCYFSKSMQDRAASAMRNQIQGPCFWEQALYVKWTAQQQSHGLNLSHMRGALTEKNAANTVLARLLDRGGCQPRVFISYFCGGGPQKMTLPYLIWYLTPNYISRESIAPQELKLMQCTYYIIMLTHAAPLPATCGLKWISHQKPKNNPKTH